VFLERVGLLEGGYGGKPQGKGAGRGGLDEPEYRHAESGQGQRR
jgi:hypothetical protein